MGDPWGEVSPPELDALATWVAQGGSLLVLGVGWAWPWMNPSDPDSLLYPVNRIGERFGFRAEPGLLDDPDAPVGAPEQPGFTVAPLSAYTPKTVRVLRTADSDVNQVKTLGPAAPDTIYVIEGEHMGLNLFPQDWPLLDDPAGALVALDRLYDAELALAGGVRPAFHGATVWAIARDDPSDYYWMYAGNPIVFKREAGQTEIIPRLNAEGHPGWGLAHEQGHNMHIALQDLFVPDFAIEMWPNVFAIYSYLQNGWSWDAQNPDLFASGHAYHAQASPSFAELQADAVIVLGCLELIWSRYGWDGMRAFLVRAAADANAGMTAGDDAARIAYMIEKLSTGYGRNFAPLFAHWGFPVSAQTAAFTAQYPASEITW